MLRFAIVSLLGLSTLCGATSLVKKSSAYGKPTTVVRYVPPSSPVGDPQVSGSVSAEGFQAWSSSAYVFDFKITTDETNFILLLSGLSGFSPSAGQTFGVLVCDGTTGVQCTEEPPWTDDKINAQVTVLQTELNGVTLQVTGDAKGLVFFVQETSSTIPAPPTLQMRPVPAGFVPITPCRIADTRNTPNGPFAGPALVGQGTRDFAIPASACNIPDTATAYSFNVAVVPPGPLSYLTMWPTGQPQPLVATINSDGRIKSTAAIIPAGADGAVSVFATQDTDFVLDINGYFAAPSTGALSLYPAAPCRAQDTRNNHGQPFTGQRVFNILGSPCAPPATAQAYVFNATVVPSGGLGYLTLWPDGQMRPVASTLNALDGFITSNMAIVPTTNGSIDAYALGLTQLVLDISGYFAPEP